MKVINLISGPRNVSTALMYAFVQRSDTLVLDEPWYGYYLKNGTQRVVHPGEDEIVRSMETDHLKILDQINSLSAHSHVFVKGMAHHYLIDHPDFILDWENVFLVRKPASLISSFSRVISNPSIVDIGYARAVELVEFLIERGKSPVILETDELLKSPYHYLRKLCEVTGLEFTPKMLSWSTGGRPEDGVWAKYWYSAVHNSTGFESRPVSAYQVPDHLRGLLAESDTYYQKLEPFILKNPVHASEV